MITFTKNHHHPLSTVLSKDKANLKTIAKCQTHLQNTFTDFVDAL